MIQPTQTFAPATYFPMANRWSPKILTIKI